MRHIANTASSSMPRSYFVAYPSSSSPWTKLTYPHAEARIGTLYPARLEWTLQCYRTVPRFQISNPRTPDRCHGSQSGDARSHPHTSSRIPQMTRVSSVLSPILHDVPPDRHSPPNRNDASGTLNSYCQRACAESSSVHPDQCP